MNSVWWVILYFVISIKSSEGESTRNQDSQSPKLVIILLDGFRWDYYDRIKPLLPGFQKLISEGVQAEFVEPIFPSLSYPSWTTMVTGLYPSHHNILGNYMLHLGDEEFPETVFQLKDNSTKQAWWWKSAEPLWITATKNALKVFLGNFAHCDVPFEGLSPAECTGYKYQEVNLKLREHLNIAHLRLREGFSLAMIYDDTIDHVGHMFGPDSDLLKFSLVYIDLLLLELFNYLECYGLYDRVNIIITSDHGMTYIKGPSGVQYVKLEEHITNLDEVYKVIGYGAVVSIAVKEGNTDSIFGQLSKMPGVDVYKKNDIPDEFHYKESRMVHDILLVARPGYYIVGVQGEKQIPQDSKASSIGPYAASHGYYNMTEMRTIFFAKGPAFKKGIIHPPIRLEDLYQIFTHILNIQPLHHNGTWDNVKDMFSA